LLAGLLLGALPAAEAAADATLGTLTRPSPVSAHAGRIAWSAFDPAAGGYSLITMTSAAPPAAVPIAPRAVPFDIELGPDAHGQTIGAYSRCGRDPRPRRPFIGNALTQMPEWSSGRGCDLYQFDFATGRETRIAAANSPRASEFLPTVWKGRVAFARVYEHRKGRRGDRAYLYTRAVTGAGRSRQVPAGNRSTARFCSGMPLRCRYTVEPGPTALDLAGRRLAIGWDSADDLGPWSGVYLDTIGPRRTRRKRLSLGHSGNIQGREMIQPAVDSGRVIWAHVLFGEDAANELRRYSIFNGLRERAALPPPASVARRPLLAFTTDGGTYVYLLSGLSSGSPGCSDPEPCELRLATDVAFSADRR